MRTVLASRAGRALYLSRAHPGKVELVSRVVCQERLPRPRIG